MYGNILFGCLLLALTQMCNCSTCGRHSCHGDVGNLAAGRGVKVSSTCGGFADKSLLYCNFENSDCGSRECEPCLEGVSELSHPGSSLVDSPFINHNTYWQSAVVNSDDERVTVQFNLETAFYFTHLIMVFKTPRPGAMIIERSLDYGSSWQQYQHYALNCSETFRMNDDDDMPDAKCTSRYSSPEPCTRGEVIYRVLNPVDPIDDPYSADSRHMLKITNLRVQMWKPQSCAECDSQGGEIESFRHFAIYDMIIRGTCFCNGHADSCVPLEREEFEPHDSKQAVVHGKCICEHNTDGDHCEKCLPLHNDAPWRAGNGYTGEANPCQRCNCNGHAESCHFDPGIWSMTGGLSGGVCDNCLHNTGGRKCDRCKERYFRRRGSQPTDPDVCQECMCDEVGTVSIEIIETREDVDIVKARVPSPCDSLTGRCRCKEGVTGRRCDRCLRGYWGLGNDGCKECACESPTCDQISGVCIPDYGDEDEELFYSRTVETDREPLRARYFEPHLYSPLRYPSFPDEGKMAASWRPSVSCICKEKDLSDAEEFCKMKYDYAIKVRVLGAEDDGTNTVVSVAVKRIIKQNKVKIGRGKMFMYPESWTVMGCTCPVLIPRSDYIVVGHEDPFSHKLMVNMNSFVKRWSQTKNWARIVNRVLRSKCD